MDHIFRHKSGIPKLFGIRVKRASRKDTGNLEEGKKAAVWGIILFVIGTVLFFVVAFTEALILVVPTIFLLVVGWGLAFAVVVRRASSASSGTIIGLLLLFGIAEFYLFPDHVVHVRSGLGFGLPHTPGLVAPGEAGPISHIILGFILVVVTMALTSALALRRGSAVAPTQKVAITTREKLTPS